ncbi:MAG: hypothetical protein ACFCUI_00750 [Bernardetiaceae bacterium]
MKAHVHTLHAQKDAHFLSQDRQDPVTGEFFEVGDRVVVCAACKSAFLTESWTYLGEQHCGQIRTLPSLPFHTRLRLRNNFLRLTNGRSVRLANHRKRILALVVDVWVSLMLSLLVMLPIASVYFWMRDTSYGVGKSMFRIRAVNCHNGQGCSAGQSFWYNLWMGFLVGMPHWIFVCQQVSTDLGRYISMTWWVFLLMALIERFFPKGLREEIWVIEA